MQPTHPRSATLDPYLASKRLLQWSGPTPPQILHRSIASSEGEEIPETPISRLQAPVVGLALSVVRCDWRSGSPLSSHWCSNHTPPPAIACPQPPSFKAASPPHLLQRFPWQVPQGRTNTSMIAITTDVKKEEGFQGGRSSPCSPLVEPLAQRQSHWHIANGIEAAQAPSTTFNPLRKAFDRGGGERLEASTEAILVAPGGASRRMPKSSCSTQSPSSRQLLKCSEALVP